MLAFSTFLQYILQMFTSNIRFDNDLPDIQIQQINHLNKDEVAEAITYAQSFNQKNQKKLTEQGQRYIYKHLIEKLQPFKFIDYQKTWRCGNQEQLHSLSIVPLIRTMCLELIQYYCEIQYQVNVFDKTLIQLHDGMKIHAFINHIFQTRWQNLQSIFSALWKSQIYNNPYKLQFIGRTLRKPLEFIWNTLSSKFGFYIKPQVFKQALWNHSVPNLLQSQINLIQQQTNNLTQALIRFEKRNQKNQLVNDMLNSIAPFLIRRKIVVPENKSFFSQVKSIDMVDYEHQIFAAMDQQIKYAQIQR